MRLLYFTDTHIRGTNPQSRLDEYPAAMAAKIADVLALARQHEVTALLHGGDLFDRPDVAPAVALQFLKLLRQSPCPIYMVAGNHDIFGYNPETIPRTMLGLFDGSGAVQLVRPGQVVWFEGPGVRVQLTGQEFHPELDRRDPRLDYCLAPVGDDSFPAVHRRDAQATHAVHMVHGMLLEREFHPGTAFTLVDQIAPHTAADLTFCGHYHPGFGKVIEYEGRRFINPGAVARLGATRSDLIRPIQAVLMTFSPAGVQVEMLPLPAARPGHEILDGTELTAKDVQTKAIEEFLQGVRAAGEFQGRSVSEIMDAIVSNTGVPPHVRDEALRRIGLAQEALATGGVEDE